MKSNKAQKDTEFRGRGVSLGALGQKHDKLTNFGQKELKPKIAPLKAVKPHHTPLNQALDISKQPRQQMTGVGVVLGGGKSLASEGKWRCKVCTWANEVSETQCHQCHEAKQVIKELAP